MGADQSYVVLLGGFSCERSAGQWVIDYMATANKVSHDAITRFLTSATKETGS